MNSLKKLVCAVALLFSHTTYSIAQTNQIKADNAFDRYVYTSPFAPIPALDSIRTDTIVPVPPLRLKQQKNRKTARTLGYIGVGLLFATPLIVKADRNIGYGTFLTGCALGPTSFFFALRSRKNK